MSAIEIPKPDPRILARRDAIVAGLAALLPPTSLITEEDERRAYETDALTAYRRVPLAVVLPDHRGGFQSVSIPEPGRRQGGRRAALARRWPAAPSQRGRRRPRRLQDEPHP
jgi:hypothetical protein